MTNPAQAPNNSGPAPNMDQVASRLGVPLTDLLDLDTWLKGDDLGSTYERLEREIGEGVLQDERITREIKRRVLPLIKSRPSAPRGAGLYQVGLDQLKWTHANALFNGATVAADGTVVSHDTLLLTVAQIGVCTVSYQGHTSEIHKELYRKDLRLEGLDPVDEMVALLEERQTRASVGYDDSKDELSKLMQQGLMAYAERGFLFKNYPNKWLMGHGSPVPRELLTVGLQTMLASSLEMLAGLILNHRKFVYVPSEPRERLLLTLGNALAPLQFVIIDTLYDQLDRWALESIYSREMGRRVRAFVNEVGPQIVRGLFRASNSSRAYLFYAHQDYAQEAALIALADSVLQEHRGFPMLLELADTLCRASFEPAGFRAIVQQTYARTGQPFRYLGERETRR